MPDTGNTLSEATLCDLREIGDPEFLQDLFLTYLDDARLKLASLKTTLSEHNAHEFGTLAHTLKGASGNIGALQLAEIAEDLQNMGYENHLDGADSLLEKLRDEFSRVETALKQELDSLAE